MPGVPAGCEQDPGQHVCSFIENIMERAQISYADRIYYTLKDYMQLFFNGIAFVSIQKLCFHNSQTVDAGIYTTGVLNNQVK